MAYVVSEPAISIIIFGGFLGAGFGCPGNRSNLTRALRRGSFSGNEISILGLLGCVMHSCFRHSRFNNIGVLAQAALRAPH